MSNHPPHKRRRVFSSNPPELPDPIIETTDDVVPNLDESQDDRQRRGLKFYKQRVRELETVLEQYINSSEADRMEMIVSVISKYDDMNLEQAFNEAQTFYTKGFLNSIDDKVLAVELAQALYTYFAKRQKPFSIWLRYVEDNKLLPGASSIKDYAL